MSNQRPHPRRIQEILNQIKSNHTDDHDEDYESTPDITQVYNSHVLYQEAETKITAEQDCSVMPDHAATQVFKQMDGV